MSARRSIVASVLLAAVALLWNGVLHLVLLREIEAPVRHLFRSDLSSSAVQSILLTVAVMALFVLGYSRVRRSGRPVEGAQYGFLFGLLVGVLVDGNQYILYPIPGKIALLWFCGGLLEFTVYGLIASKLVSKEQR